MFKPQRGRSDIAKGQEGGKGGGGEGEGADGESGKEEQEEEETEALEDIPPQLDTMVIFFSDTRVPHEVQSKAAMAEGIERERERAFGAAFVYAQHTLLLRLTLGLGILPVSFHPLWTFCARETMLPGAADAKDAVCGDALVLRR